MIIQPSKFIFLLSLLASVALYFWPTFNVTDQRIFEAAAVIMLAVGLWSTAIVPSFFGSLIFMFVAVVLSIAPPKVVFSGFHSGATWLVFGGLIFGLGVRKTGLDTRLVKSFLLYFPRFYTAIIYGVFWIGTALAFIVPSASGRVAVLVPIMAALSKELGFGNSKDGGGKGRTGLILAASMGTMVPAFGVLPSNVPNMALFGAADSVLDIQLTFGEYFLLNFPVMGFFPLLVYPAIIAFLFKDTPSYPKPRETKEGWSRDEKRLLLILILALLLWITDTLHNISPAWVSLGAAIVCMLPRVGVLKSNVLGGEINYGPVLFVVGVIGLGAIANYAGLGDFIGQNIIDLFDFQKGQNFLNYIYISLTGMIIGLFTTMPAQPAIIVSMTTVLSEATGWSHFSVIMTSLTAWGVFPFFYQTPPVIVAVALGNINIMDVTKMLVTYMVAGILIMLPLHFLWAQYLGVFVVDS